MIHLKRAVMCILSFCFMNCILLFQLLHIHIALKILGIAVLAAVYIYYHVKPAAGRMPRKEKHLLSACELLTSFMILFTLQAALYIAIGAADIITASTSVLVANGIFSLVFVDLLALNGAIRVFVACKQLSVMQRVSLLLWWLPLLNFIPLGIACGAARKEYKFLRSKRLRNEARQHAQVCQTQYPLLLLHGVFFRDWKYFNYWGRIPAELESNGARIFYGNHNSSLPVEQSAQEIKQRMEEIMQETGCDKINIIAHSKGGMDARYAISRLGMDAHAASLTTINTPHRGSTLADTLLHVSPEKLVAAVGSKYKALYQKLGDDNIDFFGSVSDLTSQRCEVLNQEMPDREGVLYQSVGSAMNSAASTILPMSLGYTVIKTAGGESDNDGLVTASSMAWGNFLGILRSKEKQGISHGDMIDLAKKNIRDFDVCEYYVELVSALKEKGL